VRPQLPNPDNADFQSPYSVIDAHDDGSDVTQIAGNRWEVHMWVLAQNIYGAKVRQYFTCYVDDLGNERWQLAGLFWQ
jgi:hypothetical protein